MSILKLCVGYCVFVTLLFALGSCKDDYTVPVDEGKYWNHSASLELKQKKFVFTSSTDNYEIEFAICANKETNSTLVRNEAEEECNQYFRHIDKIYIGVNCEYHDIDERYEDYLEDGKYCTPTSSTAFTWTWGTCDNVETLPGQPKLSQGSCKQADTILSIKTSLGNNEAFLALSSHAQVTVKGETSTTNLTGNISYSIFPSDRNCPPEGCNIVLMHLSLSGTSFSIHEENISSYRVDAVKPIIGKWFKNGDVLFPKEAFVVQTNFVVEGIAGSSIAKATEDILGSINPETNIFELDSFGVNSEGASVEFWLEASLSQHPPKAIITLSESTVECSSIDGALVALDGSSSFDLDNDIEHYTWIEFEDIHNNLDPQSIGSDNILSTQFPVGDHIISLFVSDSRGAESTVTRGIRVVDTIAPQIETSDQTYQVCIPNNPEVELEIPTVTDVCSDTILPTGFVKTMNGYDAGMAPIVDGKAILPIGESVLVWRAVDEFGNESEAEQIVIVEFEIGPWCCESYQTMIEGTEFDDFMSQPLTTDPWCILSYAGADNVYLQGETCDAAGGDFVALDEGADYMHVRPCNSVIVAHDGDDFIYCSNDNDTIYGGDGQDNISCPYYSGDNVLFGGNGSDYLYSGNGNDTIYPGSGVDYVNGGNGDDTVIVYHECELSPGKYFYGGSGTDTLYLPVTAAEAAAQGVIIISFENVVLTDPKLQGLAECAVN